MRSTVTGSWHCTQHTPGATFQHAVFLDSVLISHSALRSPISAAVPWCCDPAVPWSLWSFALSNPVAVFRDAHVEQRVRQHVGTATQHVHLGHAVPVVFAVFDKAAPPLRAFVSLWFNFRVHACSSLRAVGRSGPEAVVNNSARCIFENEAYLHGGWRGNGC